MKGLALAAGLGLALAGSAGAQQMVTDRVMTQNGHDYACSGIGKHAQNDPRWAEFPLKLVFARPDGAYLSDIAVELTAADGASIIRAHCNAPWFLAKLDAGTYKAKVTSSGGQEQSFDVQVPSSGQKQVVVTFNEG